MRRIAIVGAGAAVGLEKRIIRHGAATKGLCAARHVSVQADMEPAVFEQSNAVGGAWNYTDNIGIDENGLKIQSAMYKNLVTNLPKEVMAFPDFPFKKMLPSFMSHKQVQEYFESYCDHFKLRHYIKFETIVTRIKPIVVGSERKWEISVRNLKNNKYNTSHFDAVFICNGHYVKPHIPNIPGIKNFKGTTMHSHSYRHPEDFTGNKVVVLGGRSSGQDISLDVSKFAKQVIICHRTPRITCSLPENVSQEVNVSKFNQDGKTVTFEDGTVAELDSFIFCTGYEYEFPFLDATCDIEIENGRIKYLYKHTVNASHPTMSFIGICSRICPNPQFHYQVLFTLSLWNSSKIPSKVEMMKDIEDDYMARLQEGMPHRAAHVMASKQWDFNNHLADLAKVPRLCKLVPNLYILVDKKRKEMLCDYKKNSVVLLSDDEFILSVPLSESSL